MTSPYSIYPADLVAVAEALLARIETAPGSTWTLAPTYFAYGDQDRIPTTPGICVEPGDLSRTLGGSPNMTDNEFEMYILIYHDKVQSNETTRRETDVLAREVMEYLHKDLQLVVAGSPTVIHGFVRLWESGYAFKEKTLYRTARLTWYARNKTSLAES